MLISAKNLHDMITPLLQPELLDVSQLAQILHKSPASIRSDASRNPAALPPICRLPGNKRLLFRSADVHAWIAGHVSACGIPPIPTTVVQTHETKRARGRPRKTEVVMSSIRNSAYGAKSNE